MIVIARAGGFMLKTILQLQLRVWRETIGCGDVDPAEVLTPLNVMAVAITDRAEELLVPPERAKKLRGKFVFRFDIISECICVSHVRHFEARFIKLGPYLKITPGEAGIRPKNNSPEIVNTGPGRQV